MRELTSSLLSFTWAQTLYAVQQMAHIGTSLVGNSMQLSAPQPRYADTKVAIGPSPSLPAARVEIPVMMPDFVSAPGMAQPTLVQSTQPSQSPGWGPMP